MWHLERHMDQRPIDANEALKRFLTLEKQSTQPVAAATLLKATAPVTAVVQTDPDDGRLRSLCASRPLLPR